MRNADKLKATATIRKLPKVFPWTGAILLPKSSQKMTRESE
jgi:hypothetical protein